LLNLKRTAPRLHLRVLEELTGRVVDRRDVVGVEALPELTLLGELGGLKKAGAVEARDEGLVRFIGVTGHGLTVARMHARNLERFPIDSVLVPYNYAQMRDPVHAADFEALAALCAERGVAPSSHRRRLSSPGAAQHAGSLTVPSRPRDSPAGPVGRPILMDCG
jgi:hypothetical protein